MTRSILTGLSVAVAVVVLSGTGCQSTGVGDPCVPEQEYDPTFLGYDYHEVGYEPGSFQCQTRLCLINHFEGRVTCPYGQNADGSVPIGSPATQGCFTPGLQTKVAGQVLPQCTDRTAADTVYCSCRCANLNGATNDGANYCSCPDGFACLPLVSSISAGLNQGSTGSYCVKDGTQYAATATGQPQSVCTDTCGAEGTADCGNPNNTGGS